MEEGRKEPEVPIRISAPALAPGFRRDGLPPGRGPERPGHAPEQHPRGGQQRPGESNEQPARRRRRRGRRKGGHTLGPIPPHRGHD